MFTTNQSPFENVFKLTGYDNENEQTTSSKERNKSIKKKYKGTPDENITKESDKVGV